MTAVRDEYNFVRFRKVQWAKGVRANANPN